MNIRDAVYVFIDGNPALGAIHEFTPHFIRVVGMRAGLIFSVLRYPENVHFIQKAKRLG